MNMHGGKRRTSGFTIVELLITLGIIGLLATLAVPTFFKARTTAQREACIDNLRQLEGAKDRWALEAHKNAIATPAMKDLVGADRYIKATPVCPVGGTYTLGKVCDKPLCSIPGHTLP